MGDKVGPIKWEPHSSPTGGVKPMTIAGRLTRDRERCIGMTPEERAWRAQWLKDQQLTPREPVYVKEYHEAIRNPIRRFYTAPLNALGRALEPIMGHEQAQTLRHIIGKSIIGIIGIYATCYYFKYVGNDWTTKSGWRVVHNRKRVVPGDPNYPQASDRTKPSDYATRGFKNAPI